MVVLLLVVLLLPLSHIPSAAAGGRGSSWRFPLPLLLLLFLSAGLFGCSRSARHSRHRVRGVTAHVALALSVCLTPLQVVARGSGPLWRAASGSSRSSACSTASTMRARVPTSLRRASGAASRSTHTQTEQQHSITHTWGEVARNRKYGASTPVHEARSGREVCCVFKKEPVFIFHLVLTAHYKLPYACCLALASCCHRHRPWGV